MEDQVLRGLPPRLDRQQAEPAADQVRAGVWHDAKRANADRMLGAEDADETIEEYLEGGPRRRDTSGRRRMEPVPPMH